VSAAKVRMTNGPLDRALAFLDPLLRRAALVVEGDETPGRPDKVGNNKADARVQLARMPLDLSRDPPGFLLALRLIAEAGKGAASPRAAVARPGACESNCSRNGRCGRCLLARHRSSFARSLIEHARIQRRPSMHPVDVTGRGRSARAARLSGPLSHFVSNALGRSRGRVYAAR
jgi:hypothetical protein